MGTPGARGAGSGHLGRILNEGGKWSQSVAVPFTVGGTRAVPPFGAACTAWVFFNWGAQIRLIGAAAGALVMATLLERLLDVASSATSPALPTITLAARSGTVR
jgi:hypothetical protein